MSVFEMRKVCFAYEKKNGQRANVLNDISLGFESGKMYAIVGKSGAGKTTLLSLLAGLAKADSGEILFEDLDMNRVNAYDFRSKYVGVIFQSFNLLTKFTAAENVVLSMEISGSKRKDKKAHAYELLESVGLGKDEADRRVLKLSGGQQQRVAIARALSYDPEIILADEPTGNLDEETQDDILKILHGLASDGKCVIMVTHSPRVSEQADYVYRLA